MFSQLWLMGDADNAAHVATLVPGMTTNPRRIVSFSTRVRILTLRDARLEQGADPGNVATIAWLGYDVSAFCLDFSVASTAQARSGSSEEICAGRSTVALRAGMTHQSAIRIPTGPRREARDAQYRKDDDSRMGSILAA